MIKSSHREKVNNNRAAGMPSIRTEGILPIESEVTHLPTMEALLDEEEGSILLTYLSNEHGPISATLYLSPGECVYLNSSRDTHLNVGVDYSKWDPSSDKMSEGDEGDEGDDGDDGTFEESVHIQDVTIPDEVQFQSELDRLIACFIHYNGLHLSDKLLVENLSPNVRMYLEQVETVAANSASEVSEIDTVADWSVIDELSQEEQERFYTSDLLNHRILHPFEEVLLLRCAKYAANDDQRETALNDLSNHNNRFFWSLALEASRSAAFNRSSVSRTELFYFLISEFRTRVMKGYSFYKGTQLKRLGTYATFVLLSQGQRYLIANPFGGIRTASYRDLAGEGKFRYLSDLAVQMGFLTDTDGYYRFMGDRLGLYERLGHEKVVLEVRRLRDVYSNAPVIELDGFTGDETLSADEALDMFATQSGFADQIGDKIDSERNLEVLPGLIDQLFEVASELDKNRHVSVKLGAVAVLEYYFDVFNKTEKFPSTVNAGKYFTVSKTTISNILIRLEKWFRENVGVDPNYDLFANFVKNIRENK